LEELKIQAGLGQRTVEHEVFCPVCIEAAPYELWPSRGVSEATCVAARATVGCSWLMILKQRRAAGHPPAQATVVEERGNGEKDRAAVYEER
jgi:hypothetical protein